MENIETIDARIAARLKAMRAEAGWSLDQLSRQSGVSRATLSRLENADVSPTASVLGKLCSAYGITLSHLMYQVEDVFAAIVRASDQPVWHEQQNDFVRRSVSPPAHALAGEALRCTLGSGAHITYDHSPKVGLEHHLYMLSGALEVSVEGQLHTLAAGDSLRYQLHGASSFKTSDEEGADYMLFMV